MNPMLSAALGSVLRWAFAIVAGVLVNHGIWAKSEAEMYVAAASLATLSLGLSLWSKYHGRIKFLTALQMPQGSTEHDVDQQIADPQVTNPSVMTKKTETP